MPILAMAYLIGNNTVPSRIIGALPENYYSYNNIFSQKNICAKITDNPKE